MSYIQKTFTQKESDINKKWYLIDAKDKVLGRLVTRIATILRGKDNPQFTPHMDGGNNIVIINADKIVLTGNKSTDKDYFSHSQYPGGEKFTNITKIMKEKPEFVIEHAVRGMLPKGRLGRKVFSNLKIYAGDQHPHQSQKPEILEI